ncbi:MAG: gliding motility-associated C-terminal domain-containing protein [Bacteroidetes bacterium]|nr:gliding motility-associated C-terminal domain-containing protein [Bacteroidota bacterium]
MLKFRYYLLALFSLAFFINAKATHNRAGEITYRWLYGYTYEIKVTTYTNIDGANLADRCEDTVYFGDGTRAVVLRSNGPIGSCSPAHEGVPINSKIKLNEYITTHTYSGPGNYLISMEDPNRNAGVNNIPNSVNQVFYIESFLVIPTFGSGKNTSPKLTFPPIDDGCVGKCFLHNPGAFDIDGDSLSYELTTCRGTGGVTCPGYSYPASGGGTYAVNPTTGTLSWCVPQTQDIFNLAMIIKEWRKNDDGDYFLIGYILRDLQVTIGNCNNNQPNIKPITDTCVVAGSIITKTITATDPDNDILSMEANGGPFGVTAPIATFSSPTGLTPIHGLFNWQTTCSHIRKAPYQVTIKVSDNDPTVSLVDFKTFNIRVIAPPPLNLLGVPQGTSIKLTWKKPACHNISGNKIERYCIYRKTDCLPWNHANCEVGVPAYTGFTKIGCTSNNMNDTTFLDTNNGNGLSQGTNYSYVVVAYYSDESESYASNQVCVQLKRDVPILVNVDVQTTDPVSGAVFVRWIKPMLGTNALDTIAIPGPYEFRLQHYDGFTGTFAPVYSVTKPYFAALTLLADTTYTLTGNSANYPNPLNTQDLAHTFKIEFYANGQFIGNGQKASSVFLSLTPSDNQMTLTWQHQTPWSNYKYYIFRKTPAQSTYSLIANTTQLTYTDTGLVNGALYCYKIQSEGEYSDPAVLRPLLNFSEEACAKPKDTTPPCAPTLEIVSDCKIPSLMLQWNNPNHVCCDDVVKYNIYFAQTEDDDLTLQDSVKLLNDTLLAFDNLSSIAGCYAVTAVDSFGNESAQSAKVCVDNCPEYELPNVITVNGDGVNDFFKAIKNKFVKDIDLKIYNRWGTLVYETTDPAFLWDGKVVQSKQLATEGTYFYVCQVNEIRVKGIVARDLKGFLQIFHK